MSAQSIARLRTAYTSADKARCAERLRHHIHSPKHPERRIHRLYRCVVCTAECETQAHHLDYSRPFLVSWLCCSCHRKVEAGTVVLQPRHVFNYESLVLARPALWRTGDRGPETKSITGRRRRAQLAGVPF